MNIIKKTTIIIYLLLVIIMAAATVVGKYHGNNYAIEFIYGTWWFTLLWAVLAALSIAFIIRSKMKRWMLITIHASMLIILLGALLTHLFSTQGEIHIKENETTAKYVTSINGATEEHDLPFALRLNRFNIIYHESSDAHADYESHITIIEANEKHDAVVSMNSIYNRNGIRLYQMGYDRDGKGTTLSMNIDRWGIPVTYTGYALLFISLIGMLADPKGTFRKLLRSPLFKKTVVMVTLVLLCCDITAQTTVPRQQADHFGRLYVLYNGRICKMESMAIDITRKLYGKNHYKEFTPEQVMLGFIFYSDEWSRQPVIKIKSSKLREALNLDKYETPDIVMGHRAIRQYIEDYYNGNRDDLSKEAYLLDEKIQVLVSLRSGKILSAFPITDSGKTTWYCPTDNSILSNDTTQVNFIKNSFNVMYAAAKTGDWEHFDKTLAAIYHYQKNNGGEALPSKTQVGAERIYNAVPVPTILFMANITLGLLSLGVFIIGYAKRGKKSIKTIYRILFSLMTVSFLLLSVYLSLRWIISGNIPMSNGYETTLVLAWFILLTGIITYRHFHIIMSFSMILSGFFLLVSHISLMDPKIGNIMPVLNSPLLSIHVSVIMMAYALLSITFICGVTVMILKMCIKDRTVLNTLVDRLTLLSRLFLYPSITALGLGIFTGAIWANISWGIYWSWDPKETWALITFMLYAAALHDGCMSSFKKPLFYHAYMVVCFLSILMTYFGVNYFLGGMHSYA